MITLSMMAAAMNPRLSNKDLEAMAERTFEHQKRMIETMFEGADQLPAEQRVAYIVQCLLLLFY